MSDSSSIPTDVDFERLLVNNSDLSRIEAHVNRFNPIKIMRMEDMEIRHSAILAWLMNPQETHGLDDRFLKNFLAAALQEHAERIAPTALDIYQSDLRDTEVRREWMNIDIFIVNDRLNWAFIVENKFHAKQGMTQLEGYVKKIKAMPGYEERRLRGIFLTLNDEEPNDESFACLRYSTIVGLLRQEVNEGEDALSADIVKFLSHYIEILEDKTNMSIEENSMRDLARKIYRGHKKVFDYIIEHGAVTEFSAAVDEIFGVDASQRDTVKLDNGLAVVFNKAERDAVSFLPETWVAILDRKSHTWAGCEGYGIGLPLICWLRMTTNDDGVKGRIRLNGEVGPLVDYSLRTGLIQSISGLKRTNAKLKFGFQKNAEAEGKRYSRFFKGKSHVVDDVHDPSKIAEAMKRALDEFEAEFVAVASVLPKLVQSNGGTTNA